MIVFDIETAPLLPHEYSEVQLEYFQKKLDKSISKNPDIDQIAEGDKIKGTDPYLSRIVCIGLYYPLNNSSISLVNDHAQDREKELLQSFWKTIAAYNGIFISYNGVKFDVPYIIKRSIRHSVPPTNSQFLQVTKYNPFPPHFDVLLFLSSAREMYMSMKQACDFFGVKSSKDGSIAAADVAVAYYSGREKEIAEYCERDLISTYQLFERVKAFSPH